MRTRGPRQTTDETNHQHNDTKYGAAGTRNKIGRSPGIEGAQQKDQHRAARRFWSLKAAGPNERTEEGEAWHAMMSVTGGGSSTTASSEPGSPPRLVMGRRRLTWGCGATGLSAEPDRLLSAETTSPSCTSGPENVAGEMTWVACVGMLEFRGFPRLFWTAFGLQTSDDVTFALMAEHSASLQKACAVTA